MLNLNYNTLISNSKREVKGQVNFQVRNDPYSASIVLALPGSTFYNGAYQNQFDMVDAFSDISAYVRGGVNNPPSGSNVQTYVSKSGNGIAFATSSLVKFTSPAQRYSTSLYFNSTSSLVANQTWPENQGANLSYSSSFVIESWIAWEQTGSLVASPPPGTTDFRPYRPTAYKYNPGTPTSSSYLYYGVWGGSGISGSSQWVWDYDNSSGGSEGKLNGTGSLPIVPYEWKHYAVAYSNNVSNPFYNRKLRLYVNGNQIAERTMNAFGEEIWQNPNELLQIFGALDADDVAISSPAYLQDFRMYNGTDKNYTASIIPLPNSIVQWPGVNE